MSVAVLQALDYAIPSLEVKAGTSDYGTHPARISYEVVGFVGFQKTQIYKNRRLCSGGLTEQRPLNRSDGRLSLAKVRRTS